MINRRIARIQIAAWAQRPCGIWVMPRGLAAAVLHAPLRSLLCLIFASHFLLINSRSAFADVSLKPPIAKSTSTSQSNDLIEPSINEPFPESTSPDSITISKPALSALISITRTTDPFGLDSQGARTISLPEAAQLAIDNNLDIGISRLDEQSKKILYYASLGKFLPDINLGYQYNYLKGHANLPFIGLGPTGLRLNNPIIVTGAGFTYHAFSRWQYSVWRYAKQE